MEYNLQVPADHYNFSHYLSIERWISYYHQIRLVDEIARSKKKKSINILEIGIGDAVVSTILKKYGHTVETADMDENLGPMYTDTLPGLTKIAKRYDCILCSEVLEHLEYNDSIKSIKRMSELSDSLVISVPHLSLNMSVSIKLPGNHHKDFSLYIDKKNKEHKFDGQHYWELGKKGYSKNRFINSVKELGLICIKEFRVKEFPYHHFFVFANNDKQMV